MKKKLKKKPTTKSKDYVWIKGNPKFKVKDPRALRFFVRTASF